jgi:hypothetical protein
MHRLFVSVIVCMFVYMRVHVYACVHDEWTFRQEDQHQPGSREYTHVIIHACARVCTHSKFRVPVVHMPALAI